MVATFHAKGNGSQATGLASFTTDGTITAGDGVVVFGSWDSASTTTPTVVSVGGIGSDSFTLIYGPFTSGTFKYGGWFLQSAGTGRTGATVSWASSNPAFADAFCLSFSGLTAPTFDKSAFATGVSTTVVSADTATLSSADEFAVGYCAAVNNPTSADAPWTGDGLVILTLSFAEHRILAATTAIHTNFTSNAGEWITFCLTFMAAAAGTPFTGYVFSVGQRASAAPTKMIGY